MKKKQTKKQITKQKRQTGLIAGFALDLAALIDQQVKRHTGVMTARR